MIFSSFIVNLESSLEFTCPENQTQKSLFFRAEVKKGGVAYGRAVRRHGQSQRLGFRSISNCATVEVPAAPMEPSSNAVEKALDHLVTSIAGLLGAQVFPLRLNTNAAILFY
jgi:hypothetical protein